MSTKTQEYMDILLSLCSAAKSSLRFLNGARTHKTINHSLVEKFQESIKDILNNGKNGYKWEIEEKAKGRSEKDSIDILGQAKNMQNWIIEIDATRSDQVSQKLLSRMTLWGLKNPLNYVAILYPDTRNGKNACEKYLRYGNDIIKAINKKSSVTGIFVNPANSSIEILSFEESSHFEVNGKECKGMSNAAAEAIREYLRKNPVSFDTLKKRWGKYVNCVKGPSRYKNTKSITTDGINVYSYTQFREYGLCSYWRDFENVCKKNGISVSKLKAYYTTNGETSRIVYKLEYCE